VTMESLRVEGKSRIKDGMRENEIPPFYDDI
jgi:hypothetical protein